MTPRCATKALRQSSGGRWPRRTISIPPFNWPKRWPRWAPSVRDGSGSRWSGSTRQNGSTELFADLDEGRVGKRGAIGEADRRNGLVTVVDAHHIFGRGPILFDVDHGVGDAFAVELALEAVAITTPRRRVHGQH